MGEAETFKVGDRVESPIGMVGLVTRVENGTVYVSYRERGRGNEGIYDPQWFRIYSAMLKNLERH